MCCPVLGLWDGLLKGITTLYYIRYIGVVNKIFHVIRKETIMKNKRFLSLLLVLSILFSFSAPAYAASIETASDGNETLLLEDATIYTKRQQANILF